MLELYLDEGYTPELELLVVDEAQDLSRLQWKVVHKLAEKAREETAIPWKKVLTNRTIFLLP